MIRRPPFRTMIGTIPALLCGTAWLVASSQTSREVAAAPPQTIVAKSQASSPTVDTQQVDTLQVDEALKKGYQWLISQQADDGSWRSTTYGTLRHGVGTTALAISVLSQHPNFGPEQQRAVQQGVTFLTQTTRSDGLVCAPDGEGDSPLYATALLLLTLEQHPTDANQSLRRRLAAAIIRAQRHGNHPDPNIAISKGGWSPDPWSVEESPIEGPANVSVTAYVLEALQAGKAITSDVRTAAHGFLDRTHGWNNTLEREAGFAFTPLVDSPLNKAGWSETPHGPRPHAYHSTTCDGFRALRALGLPLDDPEVTATLNAIAKLPSARIHFTEPDETPDLHAGLYFYDAASLGSVWQATHDSRLNDRRTSILRTLLEQQQPDGSWTNPHDWMRENDPLVTTPLALRALQHLRGE